MDDNGNSENSRDDSRDDGDGVSPPQGTIISPQLTTENEKERNLSPSIATITPTLQPQQQAAIPEQVVTPPASSIINTATPPETKVTQNTRKRPKMTKVLTVIALIVIFGAGVGGAYMFGKSHEKVVVQTPELRPIDLPPQAVVVEECAVGRGKRYILPKDIPIGPVYDVVNTKVIAIEYSLDVAGLLSNSDVFSDTILKLTREYPVDHLSIVPVTPKPGEQVQRIQLIMFVVSKDEASKITCK